MDSVRSAVLFATMMDRVAGGARRARMRRHEVKSNFSGPRAHSPFRFLGYGECSTKAGSGVKHYLHEVYINERIAAFALLLSH